MKNIYLASPYWHVDELVRERRYWAAVKASARLMEQDSNLNIFSPITHSHPVSQHMENKPHHFWLERDFEYITLFADELWVLKLQGWGESTGIAMELKFVGIDMPIHYIDPKSLSIDENVFTSCISQYKDLHKIVQTDAIGQENCKVTVNDKAH